MTEYSDHCELPKVLVVDDRPENLLATRKILAGEPLEIVCAKSGNEALSHLISHTFVMILLDVQMPGMDGFETARLIRGNEETQNIPIIFVTATRNDEACFSAGYSAGAVDYLTKPICEEFLLSKIRVFLELHKQRMELQRTAADLSQSKKELEASNQALNDFAHAAAHDLKAPVRHIRAWMKTIQEDEGERLSDNVTGMLGQIDKSARQMNDLISGLLAYATLGTAQPSFESVDLSQVFEDVLATFADVINESGAIVRVADMPKVEGDRTLLHQLFHNLVGNALKYRRPYVTPRILIRSEIDKQQGQCRISIIDNGIGFDSSSAHEIFVPFRRLVTTTEFEGSGIGLSTVKKLVEHHRGTIHAESRVGEGSVFTVVLPVPDGTGTLSVCPPLTVRRDTEEPEWAPSKGAQYDHLLLVVDDEPVDSDLVTRELCDLFDISTVASADDALKLLETKKFGTILTDYNMPGSNGLSLLASVKERHPRVIRLLTSSERPNVDGEIRDTVQGFFPKIAKAPDIMAVVQSITTSRIVTDNDNQKQLEKPATAPSTSLAVLIIDDEECDRRLIRRALENAGVDATVDEAEYAKSGIEKLKEREYDWIFLDYRLPDGIGTETLRKLLAVRGSAKIISMSGVRDEERVREILREGAVSFVAKADFSDASALRAVLHCAS